MFIEWIDVISSLRVGLMYALLGLAYFLFARTMGGTINFAVGGYAMVAGLLYGSLAGQSMAPVVAMVLAIAVAAALGGVTESVVMRPIARQGRDEFVVVLAITAMLFVLQQLAGVIFGRRARGAAPLGDSGVEIAGHTFGVQDLVTIVGGVAVMVAVGLWIAHGRSGRMMRAIGDNEEAGRTLGIPVGRVRLVAACTAGGLAGLAGALAAPQAGMSFHSAIALSIGGFIALVIGGMGSPLAPLLGGVLLSVLETGVSLLFGSSARDYLLLAAVLLVFAVKPEGLINMKVRTT